MTFNELKAVPNGQARWNGWVITHGDDGILLVHVRSGGMASLTCALNEAEVDGPKGRHSLTQRERHEVEHIDNVYWDADLDDSLIENRTDT